MFIETSANQLYVVKDLDDAALSHVWRGLPVKRVGAGFVLTKKALRMAEVGKFELVRKAGAREIA
jgi:hypothetical protein